MRIEKDNFWKKVIGLFGAVPLVLSTYFFVTLCQAPDGELEKHWLVPSVVFILGAVLLAYAIFYKNTRAENEWYQDISRKIRSEESKWVMNENIDGTFDVSIMSSDRIMTTDELRLFLANNKVYNRETVEKVLKFL